MNKNLKYYSLIILGTLIGIIIGFYGGVYIFSFLYCGFQGGCSDWDFGVLYAFPFGAITAIIIGYLFAKKIYHYLKNKEKKVLKLENNLNNATQYFDNKHTSSRINIFFASLISSSIVLLFIPEAIAEKNLFHWLFQNGSILTISLIGFFCGVKINKISSYILITIGIIGIIMALLGIIDPNGNIIRNILYDKCDEIDDCKYITQFFSGGLLIFALSFIISGPIFIKSGYDNLRKI